MSTTKDFEKRLRMRLTQALPGRVAHRPFLPDLSFGRYYHQPPETARQAAVMVLHYPQDGDWIVPLTVRPRHLKDHGGQICFPGGSIDGDESIEEAAVRELQEELGVRPDRVRIVGRLTPIFVFGSGFYVTPVVAVCDSRPEMVPSPDEVAELLEVPADVLLDSKNYGRHTREFGVTSKVQVGAGHIQFGSHQIWGATAIMLGEMIEVLRAVG